MSKENPEVVDTGSLSSDIAFAAMSPKAQLMHTALQVRPHLVASVLDEAMDAIRGRDDFTDETPNEALVPVRADALRTFINLAILNFAGRIVPGDEQAEEAFAEMVPVYVEQTLDLIKTASELNDEDEKEAETADA